MLMPKNAAIPAAAEDPIGTYRIIATGDNSGEPYKRVGADQWMRVNTIDVGGYETLTDKDVDALAARAKRVRIADPGGEWHQQWANWHQHVQNAANAAAAERERYRLSGATNWGPGVQRVQSRDTYLDMGAHPDYAQRHVKQQQEALGAYGSAIAGGVRAAGQGFEQVLDRLLVGNEAAANAGYAVQQGRQHAQEEKGGDLPTLEGVVRSGTQMALTGGNVPALIGLAAVESGSQAMSQASAEGYDWDAQARQGLAQAAIEGGVTSAFSLAGKGGWEALAGKLRKSHLAGRAGATAYLRELVAKSTVKPGTKLAKDLVAGVKDVAKDSLWELLEELTITNLGLAAEQGILDKPGTWRQAAVRANIDTCKQTALMGLFGGAARGAAYGAGMAAGRNDAPTRPPVPTTRGNILAALDSIDKDIKQAEAAGDVDGADTLRRVARNAGLEGLRKDAARLSSKAFADMMRGRGWEVLDDATYQQYLDMQAAERKAPTPYEMSMDDARHELDAEIFMAALAIRKQGEVGDALPNTTLSGQDLVAEARARLEQLKALRKKPWNADTARAVVDYLNTTGRLEDAGRGPQEKYGLVDKDATPRARMLRNRARMEVQAQRAKIEERAKEEAAQFEPVGGYPEVQGAPTETGPPYPVLQPQTALGAVPSQTEPVTEQPPVTQEAAPTQQQLPVDIQKNVTQQVTQTPDTPEWVKRDDANSAEQHAASEARAAERGHRMADMQRGWTEPAQNQTQASEPTPTPNKKKLKWLGEFRVGENTTGHLYYDSEEKKFYEEMNDNTWRPLAHRAYKRATEAYSSNRTIDVWTEATPEHVDELREKAGDKFATYTWGELEEAGGLNIYGKRDKSPQLKYERQLRYALGSKKPRAPKLSDDGDAQGGVAAPVAPVGPEAGPTPEPEATESVTAPPVAEQGPAQADDTPEALEARGEWRATTPRENVKVGGRLMVIDSGDLITSTDDGYDHSLQARDRQSEASRQAIMQMGANFDPERARYGVTTDSGPAIVVWRDGTERGTDGKPIARGWHVLSGNGRTKGVQEAYAVNRGDAYRGMVRGVSARMGADTNAVDAMKRPQLVRVLDERGGKTDQEIARLSNMDVIQRMSTAEQARMDADAIGPILHLLNPGEDGNLMVAKNAPFLRAFAEAVHDESLIGTDGGWSPTIEKRIQAAVLASLFENTAENRRVLSVALEDADALGVRKILNAVLSEGPKLAAQADTKPDYGVMRELGRSLMGYIRYRQQLLSGQVKSLQDFLDQVDMFDSWSPVEGALIRGMDERGGGKGGSAAKVRTWLGRYQQLVAARDTSTGSLLGDEPSPDEGKLELLQMAGNDAAWDGMTWVGEATFASLAGPNAAGADGTRLETAILMQSFGFSREDIFSETGWWEIVPGQWVFEVDDSKGKLVGDVDHYTGALQGIYANDELYRQYPGLRNVPVKMVVLDGTSLLSVDEGGRAGVGSIEVRARTMRDAELTLLHEIQHLIQDIENHGRGTSLQDAQARVDEQRREAERLKNTPEYQQAEQALNDAYAKYFMGELDEAGLSALEKRLREENEPYRQMVKMRLLSDDYRSYLAYTGEAESRLVQMRRVMTKAARKAEPPWVTLENMLRAEGLLPEGQKPEDVLHTTHKRAPVIYARRINVEVNRLLREAGVRGRMSIEVVDEAGRMTDAEAAAHGVAPGTRKAADVDTATGRARLYRGATLQDAAHEVAHWFWDSGLLTAQERAAVEAEFGDLGQRANHEAAAKAAAAWWSSREGKPNTFVRRAWAKLVRLAKAVARAMGGKVSVEDVFEGMYGGHIARREANAARGLLRARGYANGSDYASPRFRRANVPHPGQKGWSEYADMSARAEEALARGLKTADMIAKEYGVTAAVVKATLRPAEWHHVLMRGRKTPAAVDFYDFDPSEEDSPDAARLADMRERVAGKRAEAQSINALAKAAKAAGFVVEKDGFGASVMRPGESLAAGRITENRIDIYPHDDGRLRAVAERLGMRYDAEADVYLGVDGDTYASTLSDVDAAYMDAVDRGDMETAQRMVDQAAKKAGYNIGPVWHSTDTRFTQFDRSRIRAGADNRYGPAFYFTDNPREQVRDTPTPIQLRVVLKLNNPLEFDGSTEQRFPLSALQSEEPLTSRGYDGFVKTFGDGSHYFGVYSPSQIKSADPVTYDDAGNVIPLSQRFNADNPDIRYRDIAAASSRVDVTRLNRLGRRLFGEEWFSLRDKVLKPDGREVEGRYWNAWADISTGKGNPEDTLYHEAYHRLEDLYLTDAELAILRKAVPDAEARAEGFAGFAHGRGGVTGRVRAVFSTLMRRLRQLLGMRKQLDQLHDVYDRLARGYYAGREKVGSVADAPAWADGENKNYAEKEAWYNNPEQLEGDTPYGRLSPRRRVLGSGPRLVASIVGKEFKAAGYQRLSGRTINVLDDLAEIAQVWRDPRYETFRIVYVDENNKIMHHEAITSHMPDRTASTPRAYNDEVFRRELRRRENRIKRLGAAGIWFVHNHPSGKVEASDADIKMTNYLKALYGALYRGHLIINHNKYSLVNRWGSVEYHLDGYRGEDAPDPLKPNQEVINGVRLGENISNVYTIDIVRNMQQVPGEIPFLMIDNANRIVALSSIPRSMLTAKGVPTVLNTLRRWGRATGATGAVMMFPGERVVDFKGEVLAAYEAGLKFKLLHTVFVDGYVHDGQHRMFSDRDMRTTRVNEPTAQYRDTDAAAPNPVEQRRRAVAEIIRRGNVAVGRPDLANPAAGISEPTEAVVNAVDQVREHVVKHDEEAAREAEAILAQHGGARGMLALAARKAASGEPPSAGETIAFKRTLTDLGNHAHVTGNEADLRDTINMAHYYRQMGTVLGREMRLRREDLNPLATLIESMYEPTEPERVRRQKLDDAIRGYEEERLNLPEQLREQILRATMSEQERINAINAAIRERDGSSPNPAVVRELARLYGARDRVIRRMARRAQGTIRALQAAGLHPGDAEIWSSDPASVIRAKRIISVHRAGMSDKLFELRLAAMLSGPLTHVKNTASNAAMMTWELTAQRGVEMALNSILRDSKSPSIGELPHMLRGILPGLVQGTRAAWGIMLTEDYAGTRMDREEHWRGPAVGGVVGRVARGLSLTPMTAADQWFKHIAAHVEVQARAYRIAKSQGLTGDALSARMQELIENPASRAWTEAIEFAHHVTFQSELGRSGQSLMRARSATPGARHVFPFVTTNANLLKNIVRKSPLGILNMIYTVLRGGYTGSRDTAITHAAEQVLAWTVGGAMALTLGLWDDEEEPLITGSAPWIATSRGERDLAYRDAPPNAIRTGEHTWRSYMAIEPFGPALGILVDGLTSMQQASQTGQYDVVARRAAQRVGSLIMDRTVMTGVSDLIQTLQSGEPGDYITSFLASWVPNIARQTVRASDTAIRETGGMGMRERLAHEALPSGDSVPQRYDAWGQPVTKAGGYADRLMSPARLYDTGGRSPVARRVDTMLRVWNRRNPSDTWAPGPPQRGSMTVQQYERYARTAGERALKLLGRRHLNYANPTEADIQAVQDAIEQARRWAKDRL